MRAKSSTCRVHRIDRPAVGTTLRLIEQALFQAAHRNPVFRVVEGDSGPGLHHSLSEEGLFGDYPTFSPELLNFNIFLAFPENRDTPDADGAAALARFFEPGNLPAAG